MSQGQELMTKKREKKLFQVFVNNLPILPVSPILFLYLFCSIPIPFCKDVDSANLFQFVFARKYKFVEHCYYLTPNC